MKLLKEWCERRMQLILFLILAPIFSHATFYSVPSVLHGIFIHATGRDTSEIGVIEEKYVTQRPFDRALGCRMKARIGIAIHDRSFVCREWGRFNEGDSLKLHQVGYRYVFNDEIMAYLIIDLIVAALEIVLVWMILIEARRLKKEELYEIS